MIWVAVAAGLAVWALVIYNRFVQLRVRADNAWSDISVQLKRRYDLIPNVVEAVKGYAAHEQQVFVQVAQARTQAMQADGPGPKTAAETALSGSLRQLFAVAERYPQLRANESFMGLQQSLVQVEDALQSARRYYNAVVRDLNTRIAQFPANLVAGSFGFQPAEFFELGDPSEGAAPTVSP
jgi:LemA protein